MPKTKCLVGLTLITFIFASQPQGAPSIKSSDSSGVLEEDSPLYPPESKTKLEAYAWAVGGTVLPFIAVNILSRNNAPELNPLLGSLFLAGTIVGPSLGQFYAKSPGPALLGIGIRSGGGAIALVGMIQTLSSIFCGFDNETESSSNCSDNNSGPMLMLVGGLTYLGGAVFSFVDTGPAIDRYRERRSESQFGWQPVLIPGKNGTLQTGLSAWMRF